MRKLLAGAVALAATSATFAAPVAASGTTPPPPPPATGSLTVVHGIQGKDGFPVTVDIKNVTANAVVATNVPAKFGDSPVVPNLPVGTYQVDIKVGGAVALSAKTDIAAGDIDAVVAHTTDKGAPTISTYETPTKGIAAGNARVIVRHNAIAPAVDVWATPGACKDGVGRGTDIKVISNLANPEQAVVDVPAGSYCVRVKVANTFSTVAAYDLTFAAGKTTVAHATGLPWWSFQPIVQVF